MSIFGNIVSALFHHAPAAAPDQAGTQTAAADAPASAATSPDPAPAGTGAATPPAGGAPSAAAAPAPAGAASGGSSPQTVDAKAVLAGLAAKNPQKLDWQHSIVDMMKLLGLDSSLSNRKELAQELGYTGAMDGSAEMNTWLHTEVMEKLSANGGQVPADLKA